MQSNYLKESASEFIQKIFETDTYIQRLILLRKQLEAISAVMDIVQKNFKQADTQMVKMHQISMAKLATEYIKQTYFKDAKNPYNNFDQGQPNQGFSGSFPGNRNQHQNSQIKKYLDKLNLIPDQASRDKVRKEIDRFAQIDKHSSEFHKINTYLDEVFSVPWNKYTVTSHSSTKSSRWNGTSSTLRGRLTRKSRVWRR